MDREKVTKFYNQFGSLTAVKEKDHSLETVLSPRIINSGSIPSLYRHLTIPHETEICVGRTNFTLLIHLHISQNIRLIRALFEANPSLIREENLKLIYSSIIYFKLKQLENKHSLFLTIEQYDRSD